MFSPTDFPKPTLISVNGVELEVFEAGQQNAGNPIVFCHGWPEHAFSWRHQVPALVAAGYHVIVPKQRGYGNSSRPTEVTEYDIEHLSGDLVALLDHYGYEDAIFVGHDWGANVVWSLALLHPDRVKKIINLALPYQAHTEKPWITFMEEFFGSDNYFVHFNRQPGVADAVLDENTPQFLRNLFRKNVPSAPPEPGMMMINLARAEAPLGEPLISDNELAVLVSAFETSGFTSSINWYRNLDRNWHILADVNPIIQKPALMIYGDRDLIPKSENLTEFVPNVDVVSLDCGHWIQQEMPEEFSDWLEKHGEARDVWVGYYKKSTGLPSLTWPSSVDVALCYGWIDGIRKTIDEHSYKIRFTPRKIGSVWSAVNVKKAETLIQLGKMKPAGLHLFNNRSDAQGYSSEHRNVLLAREYEEQIKANQPAWTFFSNLAPSYKRDSIWWVMSAKKEETRSKRLGILIASSEAGLKIPTLRKK